MEVDIRTITGAQLPIAVSGPGDTIKQLRSRAAVFLGPDVRCRLLLRVRRLSTLKCAPPYADVHPACMTFPAGFRGCSTAPVTMTVSKRSPHERKSFCRPNQCPGGPFQYSGRQGRATWVQRLQSRLTDALQLVYRAACAYEETIDRHFRPGRVCRA